MKSYRFEHRPSLGQITILMLAMFFGFGAVQSSYSQKPPTMEETIDQTDHIFTGIVEEKSAAWRGKNIITTYRVRPIQVWKGTVFPDASGLVTIEVIGGTAAVKGVNQDTRLTQFFSHLNLAFVLGEEILLMTKNRPEPNMDLVTDPSLIRFTTDLPWVHSPKTGRFTVLTDSETGKKYVVRPHFESRGQIVNDLLMNQFMRTQNANLKRNLANKAARDALNPDNDPSDELRIDDYSELDAVRQMIQDHLAKKQQR